MSSLTLISLLCRCTVFHLDLKAIHLSAVDVPVIASQLSADIEWTITLSICQLYTEYSTTAVDLKTRARHTDIVQETRGIFITLNKWTFL